MSNHQSPKKRRFDVTGLGVVTPLDLDEEDKDEPPSFKKVKTEEKPEAVVEVVSTDVKTDILPAYRNGPWNFSERERTKMVFDGLAIPTVVTQMIFEYLTQDLMVNLDSLYKAISQLWKIIHYLELATNNESSELGTFCTFVLPMVHPCLDDKISSLRRIALELGHQFDTICSFHDLVTNSNLPKEVLLKWVIPYLEFNDVLSRGYIDHEIALKFHGINNNAFNQLVDNRCCVGEDDHSWFEDGKHFRGHPLKAKHLYDYPFTCGDVKDDDIIRRRFAACGPYIYVPPFCWSGRESNVSMTYARDPEGHPNNTGLTEAMRPPLNSSPQELIDAFNKLVEEKGYHPIAVFCFFAAPPKIGDTPVRLFG